ncbi:bactoprenol-linked glucose translocase (gtrA) [Pandoraea horticolens]|uniref:Bactoprenol-linked glucose translocase (GtrA) n=1 Tax=Pandoraea horticolens TaxID=2508298 RepID=A0A5E4VY88_9BURK|nr:GtrA family protein [Pandoraea horticolens]VVE16843.1 bactoprenol-linked glucose translocase (gtrA) [Pandoraea horticolens]
MPDTRRTSSTEPAPLGQRWRASPHMRTLVVPLMRFGVSGVISTAVHVIVAITLIEVFGAGSVLANAVAFCTATPCSYLLNTLWSFSARVHRTSFTRFVPVAIFGLLLTTVVARTVEHLGGNHWVGIAAVVLIVPPTTFLLHRYWTYRHA